MSLFCQYIFKYSNLNQYYYLNIINNLDLTLLICYTYLSIVIILDIIRRPSMKKIILFLFALNVLVISCGEKENSATKEDQIKVAYLINGALGDQAFYDSGQDGMDRIAEDFNAEIITIENNFDPARYPQSMEALIKWGANVVFIMPYGFEDLLVEYVAKYPDIKFICIEPVVKASNLVSVDFREDEGAFLAGAVAALMTTNTSIKNINSDKVIGMISGDDSPVVLEFLDGYKKGAAYIDKEIEVKNTFIGDWSDPIKGKQAANQLYAQNADVVFQVAALTGMGVLEAAKENDKYAIGVDKNQNAVQPGNIPTSMIKDVGETIYFLYEKYLDNTLPKEGIIEAGVKEGIIYLAIDDYTKDILPENAIVIIEDIKQKIYNDEIILKQ